MILPADIQMILPADQEGELVGASGSYVPSDKVRPAAAFLGTGQQWQQVS